MPLRHFQGLLPPDALNPFVIDAPAFRPQQRRDPFVSVATVFLRQTDDVGGQAFFIVRSFNWFSQCAPALAQRPAYRPLRIAQNLLRMNDGLGPPLRRGQNFPFEISFSI